MIAGIIYGILAFIEALIGLRILLRLLGANPLNGFVNWVYDWSTPLVTPFSGIFGKDATVVPGIGSVIPSVFDWTALIAFIVYGLILGLIGGFAGRRAAR